MTRILYDLDGAAEQVSQSVRTIRRAIHSTDPTAFPPPLRGKRKGAASNANAPIVIPVTELDRWISEWPDA